MFSSPIFCWQPLRAELDLDRAPVDVEKEVVVAKIETKDKSDSPPRNVIYKTKSTGWVTLQILPSPSAIRERIENAENERDKVAAAVGARGHSGKASVVGEDRCMRCCRVGMLLLPRLEGFQGREDRKRQLRFGCIHTVL